MHTAARSVLIGGAMMTVIAATFALGRGPVPAHQFREKPFNETLHEDLATMAAESDRLQSMSKPKLVPTESIKPVEPDPLMSALSEPAAPAPVKRKTAAASDICTQHGMHKVWYGNRWRCRK